MTIASAALILVLGIVMVDNNAALTGISMPAVLESDAKGNKSSQIINGTQFVETELDYGSFEPIRVTTGITVEWTINAPSEKLNGCNNEIVIPEYNISQKLISGENIIRFIPEETGCFSYSCWMGMIKSTITVTDQQL